MAKEQKLQAGWLDRRRAKKRDKADQRATGLAAGRRDEAARAERKGWMPEPPGGGTG
jgi:hypothetical protein